jgi:putative FmdB family regulatory protein
MAIYEYQCKNCGNIIEIKHVISEKPDIIFCKYCKRDLFVDEETTKLVSLSTFRLNFKN